MPNASWRSLRLSSNEVAYRLCSIPTRSRQPRVPQAEFQIHSCCVKLPHGQSKDRSWNIVVWVAAA